MDTNTVQDDAYHTITPHEKVKRGDDADDAYHTITPHEDKKRGDDAVSIDDSVNSLNKY